MKVNYLKEMAKAGYNSDNIGTFHQICLPYLGERFFQDKNSKILDIGAGQGHCLLPLGDCGYTNLAAADRDDFNRELFEKNEIEFHHFDAEKEKFPFQDQNYDVVLAFNLIEHLQDPANFLSEANRVLKEKGLFLLVSADWRKCYKTFYSDHTHVHPYDKVSAVRILRAYDFSVVCVKSLGVLRGIGRSGLWKIIKPLMFTGTRFIVVAKK